MATTFHTPSFGDEDFNIPPLTLPGSDHRGHSLHGNNQVFSGSSTNSTTCFNSSPLPGHMTSTSQGEGHMFSHPFPGANQQLNGYPSYNQSDSFLPKFPPQTFDIPDIQVTNSLTSQPTTSHLVATLTSVVAPMSHAPCPVRNSMQVCGPQIVRVSSGQMISPPGSNTTSPGRESSTEESSDDSLPLAQLAQKRISPPTQVQMPIKPAPKKPRTPKKRKKKDPNEPQKPVSAYALFFRDTQAAIKTRNPSASFGEVSKIVASMWDTLAEDHKNDYKRRTESAKKEYLKQLAAYRATLVSQGTLDGSTDQPAQNSQKGMSPKLSPPLMQPPQSSMGQQLPQQQQHHNTMNTMTTVSMGAPHMPPMSGMPLSHMPPHNPGHMMPGYGMMQGPPPGHMGMSMVPDRMMTSPAEAMSMSDGYNNMANTQVLPGSPPMAMDSPNLSMCIRSGCSNPAVPNPGWDNEYCSNDCVVSHCRDVFSAWVASRQSSPYASVK